MGFMKGIRLRHFLDTYQEWHAVVEGFCDGFCLCRAKYKPTHKLAWDIRKEHHYYNPGRAIGFACFVRFIVAMIEVIF